ncbi:hypothetical protein ACFL51_01890 [Myxococcota bacterium]
MLISYRQNTAVVASLLLTMVALSTANCDEDNTEWCPDTSQNCEENIHVPTRCCGDLIIVCYDMRSYGVEVAFPCEESCYRTYDFPEEVGVFEYSHCGTRDYALEGPGHCWCRHPEDGRLAEGNPAGYY